MVSQHIPITPFYASIEAYQASKSKQAPSQKAKTSSLPKSNEWNDFERAHAGQGYTSTQLSGTLPPMRIRPFDTLTPPELQSCTVRAKASLLESLLHRKSRQCANPHLLGTTFSEATRDNTYLRAAWLPFTANNSTRKSRPPPNWTVQPAQKHTLMSGFLW
jgi:hypothetical protein